MGQVQPLLVDTITARRMLGNMGKTPFFGLLAEGKLKRVKLGNKTLIPVTSIHEFAASLQEAA